MQVVSPRFSRAPFACVGQQAMAIGALACVLAVATPSLAQTSRRDASLSAYTQVQMPTATPVHPPVLAVSQPQSATDSPVEGSLQMFGVRLSTATRDVMRQALRQEGLTVNREDEAFSEDIYEAPNLMPGLLQLKFSYARETKRLAKVDYVFMTFADNAHVEDVKLRIVSRFGRPAAVTGREESGPYQAVWRLPDQMEILVGREWPQKTTYLRFFNVPVWGQAADMAREAVVTQREKIQNPNALPVWVNR